MHSSQHVFAKHWSVPLMGRFASMQVGCREHALTRPLRQARPAPFQGSNTARRVQASSSASSSNMDRRQAIQQGAALCSALLLAR